MIALPPTGAPLLMACLPQALRAALRGETHRAGGAVVENLTNPPFRSGASRSVHALPLRLRRQAIGAMNLFHSVPGPLPEADLALGQALADVATIGILQERAIRRNEVVTEQLQTALDTRVIIEQAKGVLAESLSLEIDAAFDLLRRYARTNNLRLAETGPPDRNR